MLENHNVLYIWDNGVVTVNPIDFYLTNKYFKFEWVNKYAIDARFESPGYRYGMFGYSDGKVNWKDIPFNSFPKEFRASLLLLGIT